MKYLFGILIVFGAIGFVVLGYFLNEATVKIVLGGLVGLMILIWIVATILPTKILGGKD